MEFNLDLLFQKSDLIPVIIQDADTLEVLMLGFTNREAVELTIKTKTAWFWSRSRQKLWNKGESSGHYLHVREMRTDCDTDTLLYLCQPDGPTCHTGSRSCFFRGYYSSKSLLNSSADTSLTSSSTCSFNQPASFSST